MSRIGLALATVSILALGADGAKPAPRNTADLVVISKSARTVTLFRNGRTLETYKATFGKSPAGQKTCEGDNRTPEGRYAIDSRNTRSKFHIALHVSYPNAADVKRAKQARCSPGGDIMIHGIGDRFGWLGPLHRSVNWTRGCIAVTNAEIEEIARAVPNGTPVVIRP